jgi:hypothetical protein
VKARDGSKLTAIVVPDAPRTETPPFDELTSGVAAIPAADGGPAGTGDNAGGAPEIVRDSLGRPATREGMSELARLGGGSSPHFLHERRN